MSLDNLNLHHTYREQVIKKCHEIIEICENKDLYEAPGVLHFIADDLDAMAEKLGTIFRDENEEAEFRDLMESEEFLAWDCTLLDGLEEDYWDGT